MKSIVSIWENVIGYELLLQPQEVRRNWSCMTHACAGRTTSRRGSTVEQSSVGNDVRARIIATIRNPEFWMIVLFFLVGLWLTFYFIHRFADFGEMVDPVVVFSLTNPSASA